MSNFGSLIFYLSTFLFSAVSFRFSRKQTGTRRKLTFFLAVAVPVFVAMFRSGVGTDYDNYLSYYEHNGYLTFFEYLNEDHSDGATFAVWLFSRIAYWFNSPQIYFGLFATAILLPVAMTLNKNYDENIYLVAFIGYLLSSFISGFNGMKQTAAVSIGLFSMRYVYERKFVKFALIVSCACLFHPTAIACFPLYFFYTHTPNLFNFKRFAIVGGCILAVFFSSEILMMMGERFEGYAEGTSGLNNKIFYLNAAWVFVFFVLRNRLIALDKRNDVLIMMSLAGLIFGLTGFSSNAVKRIASYYNISGFLLRAQIPLLFQEKDKNIMQIVVFVYVIALFIYSYYHLSFGDVFPYVFSWR